MTNLFSLLAVSTTMLHRDVSPAVLIAFQRTPIRTVTLPLTASGSVLVTGVGRFNRPIEETRPDLRDAFPATSFIGWQEWIAEFDLSSIPAHAKIQSATFAANLVRQSPGSRHYVAVYEGDGRLSPEDKHATGGSGTALDGSTSGLKSSDVTSAVRLLVKGGRRYVGVRVGLPTFLLTIADWASPKLTVTYAAP